MTVKKNQWKKIYENKKIKEEKLKKKLCDES